MLHWTCPDCGTDCSPTVRECPTCKDAPVPVAPPVEESVTNGVLALARSLASTNVPLLAPAPQQLLLVAANGHSNGTTPPAAFQEEHVAIPEDQTIESL